MDQQSMEFFTELLQTPSPSGYEQPVQEVVRRWAQQFADDVSTDCHGNVIAALNPSGSPRILLDGHCDQIGLMVQYIDERGFLYVQPIGGWDPQILLGQQVTVWTQSGPVAGVIARKPKHLLRESEAKKVPEITDLWIDIAVNDAEEARQLVAIGDPVTVALGMRTMRNDCICGPKMDDSTGLFVVFEALRRLRNTPLQAAVYVVSAVQEEIGLRGSQTAAFGVDPHVGIAVDVTHATDCPTISKKEHGDVCLGKGPVVFRGPNINPIVFQRLQQAAQDNQLPIQIKGAPRGTANDANVIQLTRSGVAAGCLGIPNRYMHSPVEVVSLCDLETAAELLVQFCRAVDGQTDFTPK